MRFLAEWLLALWSTASARARLVGRLPAGQLVGHSFVLATLIAPAAALPGTSASNVIGAQATEDDKKVDLFRPRGFGTRDAPWRRLGDFTLPETDSLELEPPTMFPFSGVPLEFERYVGDEATFGSAGYRSITSTSTKSRACTKGSAPSTAPSCPNKI